MAKKKKKRKLFIGSIIGFLIFFFLYQVIISSGTISYYDKDTSAYIQIGCSYPDGTMTLFKEPMSSCSGPGYLKVEVPFGLDIVIIWSFLLSGAFMGYCLTKKYWK